jgi:hypothetical protein
MEKEKLYNYLDKFIENYNRFIILVLYLKNIKICSIKHNGIFNNKILDSVGRKWSNMDELSNNVSSI